MWYRHVSVARSRAIPLVSGNEVEWMALVSSLTACDGAMSRAGRQLPPGLAGSPETPPLPPCHPDRAGPFRLITAPVSNLPSIAISQ